jgi:hypothetical protein
MIKVISPEIMDTIRYNKACRDEISVKDLTNLVFDECEDAYSVHVFLNGVVQSPYSYIRKFDAPYVEIYVDVPISAVYSAVCEHESCSSNELSDSFSDDEYDIEYECDDELVLIPKQIKRESFS